MAQGKQDRVRAARMNRWHKEKSPVVIDGGVDIGGKAEVDGRQIGPIPRPANLALGPVPPFCVTGG